MERSPVTRRLAAIVIADVVGYSRLMERDEAGTHTRLREIRDGVIDPKIAEYSGRIVKTAGDGMVVEFPSASAALRCAVEVQREMGHRNLYAAADARIEFRIGINVGDILIDGDDIAGDGVNVAARLETLAEAGGICIGSNVFEQIHEDLGFGFVDIGDQQVKNIARPIRAYRVTLGKGVTHGVGIRKILGGKRRTWVLAALGIMTIGIVAALIFRGWLGKTVEVPGPGAIASGQLPALSIAIMPFAVSPGNPADDRLAELLTEDVTTALGRSARYARVVSHTLVSGYKNNAIDARVVGRELNVRYLAEGEIRHVGENLVLNATLVDSQSAAQVWSDRFDIPVAHASAGNDVVAAQLAKRLRTALIDAEARRAAHQPGTPDATELWLLGYASDDGSVKGVREARRLFDQALRLDPSIPGALIGQVGAIDSQLDLEPADRDRLLREMEDFSLRAVAADRNDPRAWSVRADTLARQWRWAEAVEALAQVSRLDPSRSDVYLRRAWISNWTGRPEEAFVHLDKAVALDPRIADDGSALVIRCRANLSLGRYDEAIQICERSAALDSFWVTYMLLTAAYAQRDEMAKALAAKAQLLKYQPGITIARIKANRISDNPVYWQQTEMHVFAGLRKAGMAEQ